MADHRRQWDQDICQNICRYNIILFISDLILHGFIINDISDHHIHAAFRNLVCFQIFSGSRDRTWIKIRTDRMTCSQFQCCDGQDTASGADIQDLHTVLHIFFQLTHAKLCRLMHTGTKRRARINMNDHLILIFRFYFFPGRDDQDIIHIKLMKILFPVVDPVLVFGLGFCDRSLSDIHKHTKLFQSIFYICKQLFFIFFLIQVKVQISDPVICRSVWKNIDKHLLFVLLRQRYFIFNLYAFHAGFCQCGDHDIFYF